MNNNVYTYTIESHLGSVYVTIFRNGIFVDSELFQLGTLEYLLKRATKWAEKKIATMKTYEVTNKEVL